jgi:hypothetical protein
MAYGVCAYPRLKESDYRIIQNFRKQHDELYYSFAEPHFSFVFPIREIEKEEFIDEIIAKTQGSMKIDFEIKCATVNKDAVLDYYHLLLAPDKGFSDVVKLHDRLYSGIFFEYLRLDIDFIPHMGIANSKDKYKVKKWADEWNQKEFLIKGTIEKLSIVELSDDSLIEIMQIELL